MIAGAIAWLVARGLSGLVANLIVFGGIALAVIGVGAWIHHQYDSRILEPARIEGDNRTLKKLNGPKGEITVLKGQVTTLTAERDTARAERDTARSDLATAQSVNEKLAANNKAMAEANQVQAKSIAKWQALTAQLKATNAALQVRFNAELTKSAADIARLREEANRPSPTVEAAMQKAKQVLEEVAAWARQRQPG